MTLDERIRKRIEALLGEYLVRLVALEEKLRELGELEKDGTHGA
jgi:hypothetical protein